MAIVVLLAGLPGVGKSRLAEGLVGPLGATILDRDDLRDAVFPDEWLDYSSSQNRLAGRMIFDVCEYIVRTDHSARLIIDGQPFSHREELDRYHALRPDATILLVECRAEERVVLDRIDHDRSGLGKQRGRAKYFEVSDRFEPLWDDRLIVDLTHGTAGAVAAVLEAVVAS